MQITELLNGFKKYFLVAKGNKAKSYKSVLSTLNILMHDLPDRDVKQYTSELLESFLTNKSKDRCWSAKTYRNQWQNLKSFFTWCSAKGYIKKNPVIDIPRPKLDKALPRFIENHDVKSILFSTDSYPWKYKLERSRNIAIISTLLFSGIRLQELLNLTIADVNLVESEIYIRKGKGGKDRIIPIHQMLLFRLKDYVNTRKLLLSPSNWFFTSVRSHKQLSQKNIAYMCDKIRKASSVYFSPHMLRHTFARMAIEAEVNLFTIKEVLGHSNISTTQRYLSISLKTLKKQICNVDFLIGH